MARNRGWSFLDSVLNGAFSTPGEGCVDFAAVIAILRDAGYRGWLVVEGEQDPAVAPAYRYAEMAYRLLSALVAGKSDAEARAAAMRMGRQAASANAVESAQAGAMNSASSRQSCAHRAHDRARHAGIGGLALRRIRSAVARAGRIATRNDRRAASSASSSSRGASRCESGDLAWRGRRRAGEPVRGRRAARRRTCRPDATCASPRETDAEIALCTRAGEEGVAPRHIEPAAMRRTVRGHGTNTRYVRDILPQDAAGGGAARRRGDHAAGPLVELSAAQARHRRDSAESSLEETYYHRLDPPQGFAFQRVYTDDRSLDEAMTVEDRDVVMVPRGYHPVIVPHGYTSYYLNVMAGPHRAWHFHNDPAHAWMLAPSA